MSLELEVSELLRVSARTLTVASELALVSAVDRENTKVLDEVSVLTDVSEVDLAKI